MQIMGTSMQVHIEEYGTYSDVGPCAKSERRRGCGVRRCVLCGYEVYWALLLGGDADASPVKTVLKIRQVLRTLDQQKPRQGNKQQQRHVSKGGSRWPALAWLVYRLTT